MKETSPAKDVIVFFSWFRLQLLLVEAKAYVRAECKAWKAVADYAEVHDFKKSVNF